MRICTEFFDDSINYSIVLTIITKFRTNPHYWQSVRILEGFNHNLDFAQDLILTPPPRTVILSHPSRESLSQRAASPSLSPGEPSSTSDPSSNITESFKHDPKQEQSNNRAQTQTSIRFVTPRDEVQFQLVYKEPSSRTVVQAFPFPTKRKSLSWCSLRRRVSSRVKVRRVCARVCSIWYLCLCCVEVAHGTSPQKGSVSANPQ